MIAFKFCQKPHYFGSKRNSASDVPSLKKTFQVGNSYRIVSSVAFHIAYGFGFTIVTEKDLGGVFLVKVETLVSRDSPLTVGNNCDTRDPKRKKRRDNIDEWLGPKCQSVHIVWHNITPLPGMH